MTLKEKIGQMALVDRQFLRSPEDIREYGLGAILSGGGSVPRENTPDGWADMYDKFQRQALSTRLGIPILYGLDAVHGHNNLKDATIFPTTSAWELPAIQHSWRLSPALRRRRW